MYFLSFPFYFAIVNSLCCLVLQPISQSCEFFCLFFLDRMFIILANELNDSSVNVVNILECFYEF